MPTNSRDTKEKAKDLTPAELAALYDEAYANGKNSHTEALKAVYEAGKAS